MNDLARSTVFLYDGQELLCDNSVDEVQENLQQTGRSKLILSEQHGIELSVHEMHVRKCVPTKKWMPERGGLV